MMENNFYDGSVTAGIVPNTHFFPDFVIAYPKILRQRV